MEKFPLKVDLIPQQLSATVHYHQIALLEEPFFCWTYTTSGLVKFGQKELVATIACEPHEKPEHFSLDVLAFFKTVYELASQGKLVDVGDYSQFGSLFFERFLGVLYLEPEQGVFAEIELPSNSSYLALLFITKEEIELYKIAGLMRILTRLGKVNCFYPYPTWTQKKRDSVVAANEDTLLSKMPGVALRYTSVVFCPNIKEITLYLSPSLKDDWNNVIPQIPPNTPVFFIAEFIPRANGALVWLPGQAQLEAISPPGSDGSAICGCFMAFCPQQEQNSAKIVEDGFLLMLQDRFWEDLKKAISSQANISIATKGEEFKQFKLEWLKESYYNPIDEKNYVAPGGWVSHGQTKRENISKNVKMDQVVLLTEEAILKSNISSEKLAPFVKQIDKEVCDLFAKNEIAFELLLQINLHVKKAAEFQIAYRGGEVKEEKISQLHEKLIALDGPQTVNDMVQFQIHFVIDKSCQSGHKL